MAHSFKIIGIRLNEAHFAINQQYKGEKGKPIDFKYSVEVRYKQTNKGLHVLVSVSSDFDHQPFNFSILWEGLFAFDDTPPKDVLDRIANINCASIIFPYVRESIADMTRRAAITPLNLPPFNFVAKYEEKQEKPSKSASRKNPKNSKA